MPISARSPMVESDDLVKILTISACQASENPTPQTTANHAQYSEDTLLESWEQVEAAAAQIMQGDGVLFDLSTIANAQDLLRLCRSHCSLPQAVAKGYWPTLSISWSRFELEVFEDRIEVYRFEVPTGTDIGSNFILQAKNFPYALSTNCPKPKIMGYLEASASAC